MTKFRKQIAKRLRELRIAAKYSQEELAALVGVSTKTLSYWENAHNSISLSKIFLLAKVLDIPVYKFFVFGELSSENNEEILNLLNSMTDKEKRIVSQVVNSILMLR